MAVHYEFTRKGSGRVGISHWDTTTKALAALKKAGITDFRRVTVAGDPYIPFLDRPERAKNITAQVTTLVEQGVSTAEIKKKYKVTDYLINIVAPRKIKEKVSDKYNFTIKVVLGVIVGVYVILKVAKK